jgi:hypothetical protein
MKPAHIERALKKVMSSLPPHFRAGNDWDSIVFPSGYSKPSKAVFETKLQEVLDEEDDTLPKTALLGDLEVGTANLFVDVSTSNVGIATKTPAYTLDVAGDINLSGDFYQGGSPFVSSLWTENAGKLYYNGGNVGVGTASPGFSLDVHGTANVGALTATSISGPLSGNASTATALQTARTIGGVSFDGSANINLPGVNTSGNQDTSGNASTATALQTARTIGGVSFDGSANINLPGVNTSGNQDTSGNASTATALQTARTIGGVSFDGSANINLPGVNISGNQDTSGNASTATALQTARNINGVSFNGSGNITITANTPNTLTRGSYLTGSNFNGSAATTWAVDATEAATTSKIVARNSSGDINCRLVRPNYTNQTTISGAMAFRVNNSSDNYIRFCSDTGAIRTFLNVPTRTGGNASGTWGINITGNAGTATATNGNGKIVVQNGTSGGSTKGIWMWTSGDSNWGIYMGQSGSGRSLSDGTAVEGSGFTSHAVRFRVYNSSGNGWIWENSSESRKMSLRASDGYLWHGGNMYNSGTLESDGRIYADNGCHVRGDWLRVDGTRGIYFESYAGGWFMQDTTYVRVYNNKRIYTGGDILAGGNVTAYSDIRHKKDLTKINNALEKVEKLSGYTYTRKDDSKRYTGLIAQEVLEVLPEAVSEEENGYSLAYGNMAGLFVEAMKEMKSENDVLKAQLTSVLTRLDALENIHK